MATETIHSRALWIPSSVAVAVLTHFHSRPVTSWSSCASDTLTSDTAPFESDLFASTMTGFFDNFSDLSISSNSFADSANVDSFDASTTYIIPSALS